MTIKKRKRDEQVRENVFKDLPEELLIIVCTMSITSYKCLQKVKNVCREFRSALKCINIFRGLVMIEIAQNSTPLSNVPYLLAKKDNLDFENLFKERYRRVPYVLSQPLMTIPLRAHSVALLRNLTFLSDLRVWLSGLKVKVCHWLSCVAFHRAVSIFDRFCIGTQCVLGHDEMSGIVCACAVLGFAPSYKTRKGKFYVDQYVPLIGGEWNLSRERLLRSLRRVTDVLLHSTDPRVRGDGSNTTVIVGGGHVDMATTVRGVFDRAKINHHRDFDLLSQVMFFLGNQPQNDAWYMCMYLMDLCLQSELVFSVSTRDLASVIYVFACDCFPTLFAEKVHIFNYYGGEGRMKSELSFLFDRMALMCFDARRSNKCIHRVYMAMAYRCISMKIPVADISVMMVQ